MKRRNVIFGTGIVALCAVVAGVSLGGSTRKAVAFDEVPTSTDRVQIYGILDHATINPIKGHSIVAFTLLEEKTHKKMDVLYENTHVALPYNFPAASHAKVTGYYDPTEKRLVVSEVSTKCPSKYDQQMTLNQAQLKAQAEWQKGLPQGQAPTP